MEAKKIHCVLDSIAKTICWIQHQKRIKAKKNGDNGKALYKVMNNAVHRITMANLRNRIDVKLVSNKKIYLKWICKPSYMSHKIFDNDLVAIRKKKVTLTLNKPAYIAMSILELSKILMYEFHYDYIKNKYSNNSRLLFTDANSFMYD